MFYPKLAAYALETVPAWKDLGRLQSKRHANVWQDGMHLVGQLLQHPPPGAAHFYDHHPHAVPYSYTAARPAVPAQPGLAKRGLQPAAAHQLLPGRGHEAARACVQAQAQAQQLGSLPALPDKLLGDASFTWPATSTAGLAISSATTIATIAGSVVRLRKAGTVPITATQAGDSEYLAAEPVAQPLTLAPVLVLVQYQDGDYHNPTTQAIKPTLRLATQGPVAVVYGELTARYWLTLESYSGLVTSRNWAAVGTSQVRLRYVPLAQPRSGAFGYVEYAFAASVGQLAGGRGQLRGHLRAVCQRGVRRAARGRRLLSRAGVSAYAANDHSTLYRNGVLGWGTEPAAVAAQLALEVQSENRSGSPRANTLNTALDVRNVGNQPVRYADLTVRYWFGPDGPASLGQWVDWAKLGASNLTGRLGQQGGQQYVETGFAPGLGTLSPGDIISRLRKSDWSSFVEDNAYSYRAPFGYAANDHITAYYQGQLVYGTEPAFASITSTTSSARPAAATPTLDVRVLGNPVVGENATLEIRGVAGQALALQLLDLQGNPLLTQRVPAALRPPR
ncbi:MAG: hypothetical protein EOO36_01140 [Cytophagaceae bacterium]|nr:MAG: hypothetical protein EOO36_01140 [Cytophagaceae bacterium]